MSLKAKMEAVIYASEEPVTLVQLAGLLGLEAQAELQAIADRQATLRTDGDDLSVPLAEDAAAADADASFDAPKAEPPKGAGGATEVGESASDGLETAAEKRAARERERKLREYLREILDELMRDFQIGDRGLEIREVAGGYRMATRPEYHDAVRGFVKSLKPPLKLTLQALETLAVVAYKQPVTAPEVSEIRGVDSGGVLGSLMARKLIATAGRKQVIGRPILYKTTKDFLLRFGLKDVADLPSIEEFEKMASELADIEPFQEEIPMPQGSDPEENTVATPEGDNESAPDQPLQPLADSAVAGLETPAGSGDLPYKKDKA